MSDLIKTLSHRLRQKTLENDKVTPDYLLVTDAEWDEYVDICIKMFGDGARFVLLNGIMCPMFNSLPLVLESMIPHYEPTANEGSEES